MRKARRRAFLCAGFVGLPAAATTINRAMKLLHGAPPFWCATLVGVANGALTGGQRLTNEKGPARLASSEAPQSVRSRAGRVGVHKPSAHQTCIRARLLSPPAEVPTRTRRSPRAWWSRRRGAADLSSI